MDIKSRNACKRQLGAAISNIENADDMEACVSIAQAGAAMLRICSGSLREINGFSDEQKNNLNDIYRSVALAVDRYSGIVSESPDAKKEHESLVKQLEDNLDAVSELKGNIETLKLQLSMKRSELDQLRAEEASLLAQIETEFPHKIAAVNAEKAKFETALEEQKRIHFELSERVEKLHREVEAEKRSIEEAMHTLKAQDDEVRSAAEQMALLESQLKIIKDEAYSEDRRRALEREIELGREELAASKAACAEIQKAVNDLDQARIELDKDKQTLATDALEKAKAVLCILSDTVGEYEQGLDQAIAEMNAVMLHLRDCEAERRKYAALFEGQKAVFKQLELKISHGDPFDAGLRTAVNNHRLKMDELFTQVQEPLDAIAQILRECTQVEGFERLKKLALAKNKR